MKTKLLALFLMAAALATSGCVARVGYTRGYDRGYYGPAPHYDRYRDHDDRRDYHRDYRYDDRRY